MSNFHSIGLKPSIEPPHLYTVIPPKFGSFNLFLNKCDECRYFVLDDILFGHSVYLSEYGEVLNTRLKTSVISIHCDSIVFIFGSDCKKHIQLCCLGSAVKAWHDN